MKFDGIFAVNDIATVGALQALQIAQICVPKEVAIIGYSDWQFSSFISPKLTTIKQNGNEMEKKAAEVLLEKSILKIRLLRTSQLRYLLRSS